MMMRIKMRMLLRTRTTMREAGEDGDYDVKADDDLDEV